MKGFWKREDRLERELRAQRPEPSAEFMRALEGKVDGKAYRRPARPMRLGLAAALTIGMLVALASFGGLGYAATGVSHAVKAATHVVAPQHKAAPVVKRAAAQLGESAVPRGDVLPQAHDLRRLPCRADPASARRDARPLQGRTPDTAGGDDGRLHQGHERTGDAGERRAP